MGTTLLNNRFNSTYLCILLCLCYFGCGYTIEAPQDCRELYPRLFFTPSPDQMLIKFNTANACLNSYVTVEQNNRISKFYCQSTKIQVVQNTTYITYVQDCLVSISVEKRNFSYSLYGAGTAKQKNDVTSYTVIIPHPEQPMNIIVTADWGPMLVRPYQPIYPALLRYLKQPLISNSPIHALLIIGDIAYDLNTNQCKQYDLFMQELSVVSPYWPIIPVVGNHENNLQINMELFTKSFQVYDMASLEKGRTQGYSFWNLRIVAFNPYLEIYQKGNDEEYQKMRDRLIKEVKGDRSLSVGRNFKHGKNHYMSSDSELLIVTSHYPIICSQDVFHCKQTLKTLPNLYAQLSSFQKIDLHLGAHMHQYERIVPYINGSFFPEYNKSNVILQKGMMASIVEGVAGCDVGIIGEDYPVENYSVRHSFNQTGFGVLTTTNLLGIPKATYTHYSTLTDTMIKQFDKVTINFSAASRKKNSFDLVDYVLNFGRKSM